MIKLYTTKTSGNGYKVRLLASMVGAPFEQVFIDWDGKEHKSPAFLKLNPRGQVPVIEVEGRVFWDSTACMVYVARKYGGESWLPTDPLGMAEVAQWLALASNEIQFGIQVARGILRMGREGNLAEGQARGRAALEHAGVQVGAGRRARTRRHRLAARITHDIPQKENAE
jgi:glutathione S-transferase